MLAGLHTQRCRTVFHLLQRRTCSVKPQTIHLRALHGSHCKPQASQNLGYCPSEAIIGDRVRHQDKGGLEHGNMHDPPCPVWLRTKNANMTPRIRPNPRHSILWVRQFRFCKAGGSTECRCIATTLCENSNCCLAKLSVVVGKPPDILLSKSTDGSGAHVLNVELILDRMRHCVLHCNLHGL